MKQLRWLRRIGWIVLAAAVAMPMAGQQGSDGYVDLRRRMVDEQIRQRGVRQSAVLTALEAVPRHLFVPPESRGEAYADHAIPIGWGQTISQPYIVALMTELLDLEGDEKVLEIGTGSGYHAAVLSRVAREVYSIEIIESLGRQAEATLAAVGYDNVHLRIGDGYQGWAEEAPFDAVILTAAPPRIPKPLKEQLKVGGRLVAPVGSFFQDLVLLTKTGEGPDDFETRTVAPVRFVPMTGKIQDGSE